jgi:CubicO group peptidase (beta-lactamase class C family)
MSDHPELSRRTLIAAAGAASAGALLIGQSAAEAHAPILTTAEGKNASALSPFPITAYHGVSGAVHQQKFNELSGQGYRILSLSVYGDRSNPLYAAVWIKRAGPAWAAIHGVDAAGYQTQFNNYTGQGYIPTIVTATGPRNNPVFAAMFEKITASAWTARHGLVDGSSDTSGTLDSINVWAKNNNCILASLAIYGTGANDRTYAGVWLPNPGQTKWQAQPTGNGTEHQGWFGAYTQVPMRPVIVDSNDGDQYAALFTDDSVGTWVARHGMTSAEYQAAFDTYVGQQGLIPMSVQGGGTGSSIRYSAVFAAQDKPIARQWTQTNSTGANYAGVHAVMKSYMQLRGIRAGVLAVRKNGTLKLSSGYTWAEPGYATTQPESLFRLASVSKAFTCAAIQRLVVDQGFNLDKPVFPLLGINSVAVPGQVKDPRIDTVTVRQCVEHTGGWDRGISKFDPEFEGRTIARKMNLARATKWDVAKYMYGEPLQANPGAKDVYSNFGYVLLGLVVEKVTGQTFYNFVNQKVLTPLGINNQVFVGATLRSGRRANEVSYDDSRVGSSAWDPWSDPLVPVSYGNFLIEAMDSGGGLVATASAISTFINNYAVWGLGGRAAGSARSGGMPGTASLAVSRTDGIDYCYIFNTAEFQGSGKTLDDFGTDLANAIGAAGF